MLKCQNECVKNIKLLRQIASLIFNMKVLIPVYTFNSLRMSDHVLSFYEDRKLGLSNAKLETRIILQRIQLLSITMQYFYFPEQLTYRVIKEFPLNSGSLLILPYVTEARTDRGIQEKKNRKRISTKVSFTQCVLSTSSTSFGLSSCNFQQTFDRKSKEYEARFFSVVPNDMTRSPGYKLKEWKF